MKFNDNAGYINNLLELAMAVMPQLDEASKVRMQEVLEPFATCVVPTTWCIEDAQALNDSLTDEEALTAINEFSRRYDASNGFEVLQVYVDNVVRDRK